MNGFRAKSEMYCIFARKILWETFTPDPETHDHQLYGLLKWQLV